MKLRIPLPKQTEKVFKDKKRYTRKAKHKGQEATTGRKLSGRGN